MEQFPLPSKFKSRKEWENRAWLFLAEKLAGCVSSKEINELFFALVTANEKKQIINRAAAAFLRRRGKSYREVGEELWLSPATISAISKSMREESYTSRHGRKKRSNK